MANTNQKLTNVLQGRTIGGTSDSSGEKTISFGDGSQLTLKTAPSNSNSASTGGTIKATRQTENPPRLFLDLEEGSTIEIPLAEEADAIQVTNKSGASEY